MTTNERALAVREQAALTVAEERRDLIRQQLAPGASDLELEFFIQTSRDLGLSPLAREIYAVMRNTRVQEDGRWIDKPKMVIQIGIDGYRAIGSRTGRFGGMRGPWWAGEDEEWRDLWSVKRNGFPEFAKVEIVLADTRETVTGIAAWDEFAQWLPERKGYTDRNGKQVPARPRQLSEMWEKMPSHMLAKCAEAQAWRKALSGQTQRLLSARGVEFSAEESLPADDADSDFAPPRLSLGEASPPNLVLHQRDGESQESFRDRVRQTKQLRDALVQESMPEAAGGGTASDLYNEPYEPSRPSHPVDLAIRQTAEREAAASTRLDGETHIAERPNTPTNPGTGEPELSGDNGAGPSATAAPPEAGASTPGTYEDFRDSVSSSPVCSVDGCGSPSTGYGRAGQELCEAHEAHEAQDLAAEPEAVPVFPPMPESVQGVATFVSAAAQLLHATREDIAKLGRLPTGAAANREAWAECWARLAQVMAQRQLV
jgi:phage recombination protein Bet